MQLPAWRIVHPSLLTLRGWVQLITDKAIYKLLHRSRQDVVLYLSTGACYICPPQVKPTHVLNAAGLTGRPNVDWCETHKV
jgi:hypothetical protein